MKTTLELPDELMRAVKIRAVNENKKLKDMVTDLLRRGMAVEAEPPGAQRRRVKLPLIECEPARPEEEMTPERLAAALLDDEIQCYFETDPSTVR